jgi:hypothetical protein
MSHRSGLRRFTILAAGVLLAMACMAGNAKTYAQTAIEDSVKLDPFDPVPQIGFHHGECDDPCGYHHCYHGCGYRRGCERDCRDARWSEREALSRYEHQADTYEMLLAIYGDQLRWYDWRYRDGGHGAWHDGEWRDGEWHEGHPDGDWHDNHWDGDHHDGPDGDHHDADHHDGDGHDDGHHDGDGHDDHHHDGQWQDSDGNWHDGPPPDGYGH